MRKYKGLFVSVSMAAMLMTSGTVFAEETETTEVVTEVASETEAASESASEEAAVESEVQAAEEVVEGGISASDRASLESYAQQSIEMIVGMDDAQAEEILHPSSITVSHFICSRLKQFCAVFLCIFCFSYEQIHDVLGCQADMESHFTIFYSKSTFSIACFIGMKHTAIGIKFCCIGAIF